MIGRRFTALLTKQENADDILREPIYTALENGCRDFETFRQYCLREMRKRLKMYPELTDALSGLLRSVDAGKIKVIESGCFGTFPLLLSALDERVDFWMFNAVPFLKEIYKGRIYTERYKALRDPETLYAQEMLFELDGFSRGKFFVRGNTSDTIKNKAAAEIGKILSAAKGD